MNEDPQKTLDALDMVGLHPDDGAVILDGFSQAVIGVSSDGRVVYSYDLMVGIVMEEDGCGCDEAEDWIDFNFTGFSAGELGPVIVADRLRIHE